MNVWKALFGTLLRALLLFVFNPLRKHGVIDQMLFDRLVDEGSQQILDIVITALVVLWSCRQKIEAYLIARYAHAATPTTSKSWIENAVKALSEWEKLKAALGNNAPSTIAKTLLVAVLIPGVIGLSACPSADRARIEKGSADLFTGLSTLSDINQAFLDAGEIEPQTALDNFKALEKIGTGLDTVRMRIRALGEITAENRNLIAALLDGVKDDLVSLQQTGVLGIKSGRSKQRFAIAITLAETGLSTLREFVVHVKKPVATAHLPLLNQDFSTLGKAAVIK